MDTKKIIAWCFDLVFILTTAVLMFFAFSDEYPEDDTVLRVFSGVAAVYFLVILLFTSIYTSPFVDKYLPKWYYQLPVGGNIPRLLSHWDGVVNHGSFGYKVLMVILGFPNILLSIFWFIVLYLQTVKTTSVPFSFGILSTAYVGLITTVYLLFWFSDQDPHLVAAWKYDAGGAKLVSRRTIRF